MIRRHDGLTVCLIYSIVGIVSIIIVVFELLSVLIQNLRLHFGLIHKVWVVSELWHTMNAVDIARIETKIVESSHWQGHSSTVLTAASPLLISLLFLLRNESEQVFLSANKVLMTEAFSVLGVTRLVKVVHIQLAYETREVVVLKVARQHILCKFVRLVDYKSSASRVPLHCRMVRWVLSKIKMESD